MSQDELIGAMALQSGGVALPPRISSRRGSVWFNENRATDAMTIYGRNPKPRTADYEWSHTSNWPECFVDYNIREYSLLLPHRIERGRNEVVR